MNWKEFWDRQALLHSNPQIQVGRIKSGITLSEQILDDIVQHIVAKLELGPTDRLLDLCCGNGLLSHRLSQHCQEVVAIDISPQQIKQAKAQFAAPNIQYSAADVSEGNYCTAEQKFTKINLYFSFQYFENFSKGKKTIAAMLPYLQDDGMIFIGDVPDFKYLNRYYSRAKDRFRYRVKLLLGNSDMGKFWSEGEMRRIAADLDLTFQLFEQPAHLPYAEYRRDYLLKKN